MNLYLAKSEKEKLFVLISVSEDLAHAMSLICL